MPRLHLTPAESQWRDRAPSFGADLQEVAFTILVVTFPLPSPLAARCSSGRDEQGGLGPAPPSDCSWPLLDRFEHYLAHEIIRAGSRSRTEILVATLLTASAGSPASVARPSLLQALPAQSGPQRTNVLSLARHRHLHSFPVLQRAHDGDAAASKHIRGRCGQRVLARVTRMSGAVNCVVTAGYNDCRSLHAHWIPDLARSCLITRHMGRHRHGLTPGTAG
jgi:hypothetical protein